ncbi:hypothetical protein EXS97_07830 [Helicobacter pylori]|nr:hypothetical protein [Helicobacter pylori]
MSWDLFLSILFFLHFRSDRESRIKASDTNLRTERNHAQKRFKGGLRADFNNRISASRTLKQLTMTTEPKQPKSVIFDYINQ